MRSRPTSPLVELETDKVTVEVNAPAAGMLADIAVAAGATVNVGAVLGNIGEGKGAASAPAKAAAKPAAAPSAAAAAPAKAASPAPAPAAAAMPVGTAPSAAKIITEKGLDAGAIAGTGKDGRITKGDALAAAAPAARAPAPAPAPATPRAPDAREARVRMTRLRKRIAERLKEAQNTAAMLTTFNEVDMTAIIELRNQFKDAFEKKHGVKLGFMSFFVKACVAALKDWPAVNGEIDGDELVYKNFYDIGVAVGTEDGLVVPSCAMPTSSPSPRSRRRIADLRQEGARRQADDRRNGGRHLHHHQRRRLRLADVHADPQSAADRGSSACTRQARGRWSCPTARSRSRPMMYLALSYDHRIVDGREAVSFLVRVKECLEDPQRLLVDM